MKTPQRIARELAHQIADGDLGPGTRLPTEREMAEQLGVGRTTLREALRLLETSGVISIRSGRMGGPTVRRPRTDDLDTPLELILQFQGTPLADVLEARSTIEPMIASLAVAHMTDDHLDRMQETVDVMMENLDHHERCLVQTGRFHNVIADATGNAALRIFQDSLKEVVNGAIMGADYPAGRHEAIALDHQRIIHAFQARDAARVFETMQVHLDEASRYLHDHYHPFVARSIRWDR